jgi:hypothetical protein
MEKVNTTMLMVINILEILLIIANMELESWFIKIRENILVL